MRLTVKFGEHEFFAEGRLEAVQESYRQWLNFLFPQVATDCNCYV